jgi:SagB-type dehydrogenase family enzyme
VTAGVEISAVDPRALSPVVYGPAGVRLDDPAEHYHEASKSYASFSARDLPGLPLLESEPALRQIVARATKRHAHRPTVSLPRPVPLRLELGDALRGRRSQRELGGGRLSLAEVGTVLDAGYGVARNGGQSLRSAPSGGALYPLELYAILARVEGMRPGLYHFDPSRHALEQLRPGELGDRLRQAMVYPELADAAVFLAVTAMFWRTRFKYGLRGYRFALLEAGHVVQNALLAAHALGLAAAPVGGFFDRRLDELLGVDGVNESIVYGLALGRSPGSS